MDPRLELVDRIVTTAAFQKATRLQAFLRFIVEQTIQGNSADLSEYRIGREVFEKGKEYSPLLDSSVRVQARQLRLKLHEYFDGPGRQESMVLEIPKGSYVPTFRRVEALKSEAESISIPIAPAPEPAMQAEAPAAPQNKWNWIPWCLAAWMCVIAIFFASRDYHDKRETIPWPLSTVFSKQTTARLILADSSYQITATANGRSLSLEEYLRSKPRNDAAINLKDSYESRLAHALAGGTFTSFADAVLVGAVSEMAGKYKLDLDIKSAKDIDPRDLEGGNFILIGSASSNPWVTLYSSRLNFREEEDAAHPGAKLLLNVNPKVGEPRFFEGSAAHDAVREDYADLAVVRGLGERGSVMMIQGLRHEATEAAGRLLADSDSNDLIKRAFEQAGYKKMPQYFEVVLATRSIAGIPQVTKVVALRATQP